MLNHTCNASTAIEIELDNSSWSPQLAKRERLNRKAGAKGQDWKAGAKVHGGKVGANAYDEYKGGSKHRSNPKAKPRDGPWKGREESQRMEEEMMILVESAENYPSGRPRRRRRPRPSRQIRDKSTMEWVKAQNGQATKSVEAIVVHGINCHKPIEITMDNMIKALGDGVVVGARWLLQPSRRKKLHSSMVIYLGQTIKMLRRAQNVILYGRIHLVEEYDFDRGSRLVKEVEFDIASDGWCTR